MHTMFDTDVWCVLAKTAYFKAGRPRTRTLFALYAGAAGRKADARGRWVTAGERIDELVNGSESNEHAMTSGHIDGHVGIALL
jgi:hypothetical protein